MTFSNKTWHIIYNSCMVLLQDALDSILSSCLCELCPYVMCTSVCTLAMMQWLSRWIHIRLTCFYYHAYI